MAEVKITVTGVDNATSTFNGVDKSVQNLDGSTGKLSSTMDKGGGKATDFIKGFVGYDVINSAAGALAGLAAEFVEVNAANERYQTTLETLLGSQEAANAKWEELNAFARETPFQVDQVMEAFTTMKAMGLDPTIETMTTLGDTAAALGGDSGKLDSISRALGQIQSKGKVSAEELMQLKEAGVAATDILKEEFNLTADQLSDIGNAGISATEAVQALLEGMQDKFGGQMEELSGKWTGMMSEMQSLWRDFLSAIGEAGAFEHLKEIAAGLRDDLVAAIDSGQVKEWTETLSGAIEVGLSLTEVTMKLSGYAKDMYEWFAALPGVTAPLEALVDGITAVNAAAEWIDQLAGGIEEGEEKIRTAGEQALDGLDDAADTAVDDARGAGEQVAEGVAGGIEAGEGKIRTAGEQALDGFDDAADTAVDDARGAGEQVAEGVAEGIEAGSKAIEDSSKSAIGQLAAQIGSSYEELVNAASGGLDPLNVKITQMIANIGTWTEENEEAVASLIDIAENADNVTDAVSGADGQLQKTTETLKDSNSEMEALTTDTQAAADAMWDLSSGAKSAASNVKELSREEQLEQTLGIYDTGSQDLYGGLTYDPEQSASELLNLFAGFSTEELAEEKANVDQALDTLEALKDAGMGSEYFDLKAQLEDYRDLLETFHGGGAVGGSRYHGGGRGLAHDEVPAVLQSGEFVMQRSAVDSLGAPLLEAMNRMHGGGLAGVPRMHSGGPAGHTHNDMGFAATINVSGGGGQTAAREIDAELARLWSSNRSRLKQEALR